METASIAHFLKGHREELEVDMSFLSKERMECVGHE